MMRFVACACALLAACASAAPVQGTEVQVPAAVTAEQPSCEERARAAGDLINQHNRCGSDADCRLAQSEGGCPPRLACATPIAKQSAAAFERAAAELSKEYQAQCEHCARPVTLCYQREPVCRAGRCELQGIKH